MTNVDRIVIELALEVLEDVVHRVSKWDQVRDKDDKPMPPHNQNPEIRQAFEAISLIKKVLAQPEQEPVQRTRVGLTEKEVDDCYEYVMTFVQNMVHTPINAVMKLRIKNDD